MSCGSSRINRMEAHSLLFDSAPDEVAILIGRDVARAENQAISFDGLGLYIFPLSN